MDQSSQASDLIISSLLASSSAKLLAGLSWYQVSSPARAAAHSSLAAARCKSAGSSPIKREGRIVGCPARSQSLPVAQSGSAPAWRSPCGTGDPHAGGFFRGPPARDISAPAPRPRRARETWTAGSAAGFVAPAPGPAPAHEGTGLARGLPAAARRLNFKLKFNLAWSAAPANGPPLSATSRRGSRGRPRRVLPWTAGSFPSPAGPRPRPSAGSAGSGPAGPPSRRGSC